MSRLAGIPWNFIDFLPNRNQFFRLKIVHCYQSRQHFRHTGRIHFIHAVFIIQYRSCCFLNQNSCRSLDFRRFVCCQKRRRQCRGRLLFGNFRICWSRFPCLRRYGRFIIFLLFFPAASRAKGHHRSQQKGCHCFLHKGFFHSKTSFPFFHIFR